METIGLQLDTHDEPTLQHIVTIAGYDVRSYSGRGMGGIQCLGVDLEAGKSLATFTADLLAQVASLVTSNMNGHDVDYFHEAMDAVIEGLRKAQTDSMGRGTIIYFPGVKYVLTAADEEGCPSSEE